MEMKLHSVLLAGCMNCTRMYLPLSGNFYPKHLFSLFSSRMGGTRTFVLCSARTVLYPPKYTVPLGNRELGLCSRSYSAVGSNALCSQTLSVSTWQPRRSQSVVVRKELLLQGGATWPGKNESLHTDNRSLDLYHSRSNILCCYYIVLF